jgi:hypothetical protein
VRKDYDGERASHLIFAEVDEMYASGTNFHAQDLSRHTLRFSDLLFRVTDGKAVGSGE